MKYTPLNDRVLLEIPKKEEGGGLILPDSVVSEKPTSGKIIAIGPDVKTVKVGDIVGFSHFGPEKLTVGEDELLVISEEQIYVKCEEE